METAIYYIVVIIVSVLVQMALAPKPTLPEPATFNDFEFPQYEEGTPQAVVFGDVRIKGWMVLTYGNFRAEEIRKSGGKK